MSAYYNISVHLDEIQKVAITAPLGLFEFVRMPFGSRNANQIFQRIKNSIFRDLENVFVYIDDILVGSSSDEEHKQDHRDVYK